MVTNAPAYGSLEGGAPVDLESPPPVNRKSSMVKRKLELDVYDPYDWKRTVFGMAGSVYLSKAMFVVGAAGTFLIALSGMPGVGLIAGGTCRGWCSHMAIGSQAHQYMGIVLFLLMAFRNNQAYQMYQSGLKAHFAMKANLRSLAEAALFRVPAEAFSAVQRARIIAFAIAFPYAVTLDLRDEGVYDDADSTIETLLAREDVADLQAAETMPMFVLDSLTAMVSEYSEGKDLPVATLNAMYGKIDACIAPFGECERIKQNPCAFAYVAHMRVLLIAYLVTLPLALVENMGLSTIPVYWVVCYALMSLEMLAVDVENPFGYGASDLRLNVQNKLIKESIMESWNRFLGDLNSKSCGESRVGHYSVLTSM